MQRIDGLPPNDSAILSETCASAFFARTGCSARALLCVGSVSVIDRERTVKAFQDYYPDESSHCYGCGRLNEHGLKVKSYWDGEETVATFRPSPYHMAAPCYVYGGLLASIIDCHGTGTAAAAAYRAEQRAMDTEPPIRFLTASLHVVYVRPTPLGVPLEIRGRVKEFKGRKVVVSATVSANGEVCVRGEVVAVQVPDNWVPSDDAS